MAVKVVVNAKMRRTGICGATETLLVDRALAGSLLPALLQALKAAGCAIRGDATVRRTMPETEAATEEDWATEYLATIIAVQVVDGLRSEERRVGTESVSQCRSRGCTVQQQNIIIKHNK